MITLTWLTKFWFLLLIAGVILLNSVYLKGNYLKHFFDFGELKRIEIIQKTLLYVKKKLNFKSN